MRIGMLMAILMSVPFLFLLSFQVLILFAELIFGSQNPKHHQALLTYNSITIILTLYVWIKALGDTFALFPF